MAGKALNTTGSAGSPSAPTAPPWLTKPSGAGSMSWCWTTGSGRLAAQVVQDSFRVSPDNKRLALVARHQDKWQVMVDARPDPPFEFIFAETLRFSPNSAHTGYLALKGQKLVAVVNGQVKDQRDILAPGTRALEELLRQVDDQGVPPKVEAK